MSFGTIIREQRKKAGLSQEQLAEKINVSRQAITKWETEKGIPDIANLIALSDEFGMSLDELIKENITVKNKGIRILWWKRAYKSPFSKFLISVEKSTPKLSVMS